MKRNFAIIVAFVAVGLTLASGANAAVQENDRTNINLTRISVISVNYQFDKMR